VSGSFTLYLYLHCRFVVLKVPHTDRQTHNPMKTVSPLIHFVHLA